MVRDYYTDAYEIAERLAESGEHVWFERQEQIISARFTATEIPGLFAIDVAPSQEIHPLVTLLQEGQREGLWDYDEANLTSRNADEPRT